MSAGEHRAGSPWVALPDPTIPWVHIWSNAQDKVFIYHVSAGTWTQRSSVECTISDDTVFTMTAEVRSGLADTYAATVLAEVLLADDLPLPAGVTNSREVPHRPAEDRQAVAFCPSRLRGPAGVLRPGHEALRVRHHSEHPPRLVAQPRDVPRAPVRIRRLAVQVRSARRRGRVPQGVLPRPPPP